MIMKNYDEKQVDRIREFVSEFQRKEGKSPSLRAIMHGAKLNSLGQVSRGLKILENRGELKMDKVKGVIEVPHNLKTGKTIIAPIVGSVACGKPKLAVEEIEKSVALPTSLFGGGETFMLVADGLSMIEEGIMPGDLLVVKKNADFENGDLVIALVDDSATAKRFYKEGNKVILHPANKEMKDIIVEDLSELKILGRVVNVIKEVSRFQSK